MSKQRAAAREYIGHVIDERFAEIRERVEEAFTRELESRVLELRGALRREPGETSWSELPVEEQGVHLQAQRFARVKVAEMRLYKAQEVWAGRAQRNLYSALRENVDVAREAFRLAFVARCASMADYLHAELVRTLANDDAGLLGPEYPGPLV